MVVILFCRIELYFLDLAGRIVDRTAKAFEINPYTLCTGTHDGRQSRYG